MGFTVAFGIMHCILWGMFKLVGSVLSPGCVITRLYDVIVVNYVGNRTKALPVVSLLIDLTDQVTRAIQLGVILS